MSEGPALPQRPKSPFSAQLEELKQAFPDADKQVRRAILVAASGNLENAFNGLLALTDDTIRPPPPQQEIQNRHEQLRNDEELARRLAQPRRRPQQYQDEREERGRSDDINVDEIRDNIQKWGNEASKNIGSFFNTIKSRIQNEFQQEEPDEDFYGRPDPLNRGSTRADAYRQVQEHRQRPSQRPHFIEMNEEEPPAPPPKPTRPSSDTQKVNAFGDDKPARWEPLRSTTASDAFFICESDEEVDSIKGTETEANADKGTKETKETKETEPEKTESKETKPGKEIDSKIESKEGEADSKSKTDPKSKEADSKSTDKKDDSDTKESKTESNDAKADAKDSK